ncbi:MAG: hypothetical protein Q4F66_00135 [Clostridium sp.]|nr:hypothetical protein [Clostridium sp.]
MKTFIRIIVCTLVAIGIQQGVFFYIENIYLDTDADITVEKVDETNEEENVKQEEIQLKADTGDVSLSDNGRYAAYMVDNKLRVLDSYDGTEKQVSTEDNETIVYHQWLTNENNMIIIKKVREGRKSYFEPITYYAKKDETRSLTDFDISEIKIDINDDEEKVENVIFSTATSSLYIKIKKPSGRSDLYYLNIMNQLELVRKNKEIGDIIVPPTTTKCVMEMGNYATILNRSDNIQIPNVNVTKILGTDMNDNVYFGEEIDGKITKIHYSVLNDANSKWMSYTLSKPVNKEDISIDYSGRIFVNDEDNKVVNEITSGQSVKYEGKYVQIYSKGIISRSGDKLLKTEMKDTRLIKN